MAASWTIRWIDSSRVFTFLRTRDVLVSSVLAAMYSISVFGNPSNPSSFALLFPASLRVKMVSGIASGLKKHNIDSVAEAPGVNSLRANVAHIG